MRRLKVWFSSNCILGWHWGFKEEMMNWKIQMQEKFRAIIQTGKFMFRNDDYSERRRHLRKTVKRVEYFRLHLGKCHLGKLGAERRPKKAEKKLWKKRMKKQATLMLWKLEKRKISFQMLHKSQRERLNKSLTYSRFKILKKRQKQKWIVSRPLTLSKT